MDDAEWHIYGYCAVSLLQCYHSLWDIRQDEGGTWEVTASEELVKPRPSLA